MCSHLKPSVKLDETFVGHKTCACIKLRYLVRSGGPNFIPSVRGPVRFVRSEKYTQPYKDPCLHPLRKTHVTDDSRLLRISNNA